MRTLVHLSDLHFGRVDAELLEPLRAAVEAARADLVVVSGDLTQRAKRRASSSRRAPFSTACRRRGSSSPATTTCRSTASGSAS